MELVKSIIILVIGFALLMKGADYFVEGSSSVAKRLYIPSRYACKRISIIDYLFSFVDRTGIFGNEVGTYRWNCLFNSFRRLSCLDDQFRKESKSSAQRGRADERIRRVCRR